MRRGRFAAICAARMGTRARAAFLLLKKELLALACIGLKAFFIHFLPTRRGAGRPCGGAGPIGARPEAIFRVTTQLTQPGMAAQAGP